MNDKLQQALVDIIEAVKTNSGPIAERLLAEYALRSWVYFAVQSFVGAAVVVACICIVRAALRMPRTVPHSRNKCEEETNEARLPAMVFGWLFMVIGVVVFATSAGHAADAVSPLFSLVKELMK